MRFKGLDLNLLVALDVLLDERSVSRAAERLNVSQPAMSASLSRMREYFADPILQVHGRRMVPTAHALRIQPRLKALLRDADLLVSESSVFDPATSDRRFRIGTSDYVLAVLLSALARDLAASAPNVSIETLQPSELIRAQLDQGTIDLVIAPEEHVSPDHPAELLLQEEHVVVGWNRNPVIRDGTIHEDDYFNARHVVVELGHPRPASFAETRLQKLARDRRVDVRVPSFLAAPELVVNTGRLTVMHARLARLFADRLPIAIAALPFDFPPMREMLQYHQKRATDPGLGWLIARLHELARAAG